MPPAPAPVLAEAAAGLERRRTSARALLGAGIAALLACSNPVPPPVPHYELPAVHRLAPGETLWDLSERYGVPVDEIAARNGIADPRRLPVGLELVIPRPGSRRRPAPPAGPAPADTTSSTPSALDLGAVDQALARAELDLRAARFTEALVSASYARGMLDGALDPTAVRERVVQAELLIATVLLAQGLEEAARESLARALAADPSLTLDPAQTPPKLLNALERLKHEASSAEPRPAGDLP